MALLPRSSGGGGGGGGEPDPSQIGGYALTSVQVVVTAQNVANKYFDLPAYALDMTQAYLDRVVVTLNTDAQYSTLDYVAVADGTGKYRRISWVGKYLESDPPVHEGDRVWVLYHIPIKGSGDGDGGEDEGEGGGGHVIVDPEDDEMPQRAKLQFKGSGVSVTDDEGGDTTVVALDYLRPFAPSPLAPENELTGTALFVRLKITPYEHPIGIPIGGVHWQVATDENFTAVVFDQRIVSASDSVVVTESEATVPYLTAGTEYFWRARYFDLMDTNSDWSEVWSFETDANAGTATILQPDIAYPVNGGWMPEKKLLVQLSDSVSLGTLAPDKMDLQVSMTPNFDTADILEDYQDYADTRLLLDDTADFSTSPSPLYLRARHKDSVAGVTSMWSSIPTVWIQKAFGDIVFGMDELLVGNGTSAVLRAIDENGNPVTTSTKYFDDHPTYNGIVNNTSLNGNDMAFIPAFYIKVWHDLDDSNHKRYFLSPVPKDGYDKHPAFRYGDAANGFFYGRYLNSTAYDAAGTLDSSFSSNTNPISSLTTAQANTMAGNINIGNESGWHNVTVWEDRAVMMLALMENLTYDLGTKLGATSGPTFPSDSKWGKWRDIFALVPVVSGKSKILNGVSCASSVLSLSTPESPMTPLNVGLPAMTGYGGTMYFPCDTMHTGYNAALDIEMDLVWAGLNVNQSSINPRFIYAYGTSSISSAVACSSAVGIGPFGNTGYARLAKW
jgi:hypothetical protein